MTPDYCPADLYRRALDHALQYLNSLPTRPVGPPLDVDALRTALSPALTDGPIDPMTALDEVVAAAAPGIVASSGPRFYGFVTGGGYPAAVAADWMAAVWDQNPALYVSSPALAIIESVAASWLVELFGLPHGTSTGFVTGGHMANFTALAAARHEVLRRAGWDVEAFGLQGAPTVNVVLGEQAHISVYAALRLLGLGARTVKLVPADEQGRMRSDALPQVLATCDGPTIVCAQAGNVNTGAFDPLGPIAAACAAHGAWLHVDGAFGLWAATSPAHRYLVDGLPLADSWSTDGHKWLNVPYDSGLVFVKHAAAHRAAMSFAAAYLVRDDDERNGMDWVPESSRRARALPVYLTLRTLGRNGVAELVERCCTLARRMAERLSTHSTVRVLNDVVLNQVLVALERPGADAVDVTARIIGAIQRDATCWVGGSNWYGRPVMRISISNWGTTEDDIDRSAQAILRILDHEF